MKNKALEIANEIYKVWKSLNRRKDNENIKQNFKKFRRNRRL